MASHVLREPFWLPSNSVEYILLRGTTELARLRGARGERLSWREAADGCAYVMVEESCCSPGTITWAGMGERADCAYAYMRDTCVPLRREPDPEDPEDYRLTELEARAFARERLERLTILLGRPPALEVNREGDRWVAKGGYPEMMAALCAAAPDAEPLPAALDFLTYSEPEGSE